MEKIEDGDFNSIQFYLKSADRDTWAEKTQVDHNLNLAGILDSARARVIDHETAPALAPASKRASGSDIDNKG